MECTRVHVYRAMLDDQVFAKWWWKDHKTRMFISAVHRRYAGWWCAHGAHVAEMYVAYNIASCRCNRLPPLRQPRIVPRLRFHFARERLPTARGHSSAMPTEFIRWGALDTDLNLASCFSRNLLESRGEGSRRECRSYRKRWWRKVDHAPDEIESALSPATISRII